MPKSITVQPQLIQLGLQFLLLPPEIAQQAIALEDGGTIYANASDYMQSVIESAPPALQPAAQSLMQFLAFADFTRSQHPDDISITDFVQTARSVLKSNLTNIISQAQAQAQTQAVQFPVPENQVDSRIDQLMQVLVRFLKGESSFGQSHRANALLACHANNFAKARIITDVRAVFVDDENDVSEPVGALITHVLKIEYVKGSNSNNKEEFFVGLDEGELAELKKAIERAEKKAVHLRSMITASGFPYFGLAEGVAKP